MRFFKNRIVIAALLVIVMAIPVFSQRTRLKPGGFNLFSTEQDVQLGQQVAQDAEQKLPMLNDARVDDYLNRLGRRLAANAPGAKYPYSFKAVNDANINAFALPGGFLFVNRGTIEAAENEAELAGVMGHEIGHAALRHGTNQATKSYIGQFPLAFLGGMLGKSNFGSIVSQLGGFAASSILLKYSRDDEREADLVGAQLLYDANYDPRYLATFFEKLGPGKGIEFLSSHPNPENRVQKINVEISKLGPLPARPANDSAEFRKIRQYVRSLPPAPKNQQSRERE